MNEFREQIKDAVEAISTKAPLNNVIEKCATYFDCLMDMGSKINLTSISSPEEFILRHFLDSIEVLRHVDIKNGSIAIDIGSGAGFPGIPLKIVRPDIRLISIESIKKKACFQEQTLSLLGCDGWEVISERAEIVGRGELRGRADIVVARAVTSLPVLIEYTLPLINMDGRVVLHRGRHVESDINSSDRALQEVGGAIEKVVPYSLTGLEEGRGEFALVVIRKEVETPDKFPRRPGIPDKRPLT